MGHGMANNWAPSPVGRGGHKEFELITEWYLKVLRQYVDFAGRARRKEYWMFTLINVIISVVLAIIDAMLTTGIGIIPLIGPIVLIVFLATDGERQPNAYGPDPKAVLGAAVVFS